MRTLHHDSYGAFRSDYLRLLAMVSRDQRDKSIARARAVAVVTLGLGLILTGHADSVTSWLAGGLGAYLGLRL